MPSCVDDYRLEKRHALLQSTLEQCGRTSQFDLWMSAIRDNRSSDPSSDKYNEILFLALREVAPMTLDPRDSLTYRSLSSFKNDVIANQRSLETLSPGL